MMFGTGRSDLRCKKYMVKPDYKKVKRVILIGWRLLNVNSIYSTSFWTMDSLAIKI